MVHLWDSIGHSLFNRPHIVLSPRLAVRTRGVVTPGTSHRQQGSALGILAMARPHRFVILK